METRDTSHGETCATASTLLRNGDAPAACVESGAVDQHSEVTSATETELTERQAFFFFNLNFYMH